MAVKARPVLCRIAKILLAWAPARLGWVFGVIKAPDVHHLQLAVTLVIFSGPSDKFRISARPNADGSSIRF